MHEAQLSESKISPMELDPRVRMLIALFVCPVPFLLSDPMIGGVPILFAAALLLTVGNFRLAGGGVTVYALSLVADAVMPHIGSKAVMLSLGVLLFVVQKLLVAIMFGGFLRKTTNVTELIIALETMRVPQLVIIPVAVSARYIPSIQEDFKYLKDSLRVRNIPLSPRCFILHPVRTIEYLLVPILMRSFKFSDELAASAMLRGLDNGRCKTQLRILRVRYVDIAALSVTAVVDILTVYLQYRVLHL